MDHKVYESNMIDSVNRKCKNAEHARLEAYIVEQEKIAYNQRLIKSNAAARIIAWVTAFLSVVLGLCYLSWLSIIPSVIPAATCAVVGLVTGMRVNALARAFKNN